jgi:two-component system sensor histidine kinase HydH
VTAPDDPRIDTIKLWERIAHKVRNPLTSISTSGQLLQLHLADDEQNAELADIVVRESERLARIIDQIDELLRPETLRLDDTDLARCMNGVVDFVLTDAGVSIDRRYASPGPVIEADSEKVSRIFAHVVRNAVEAAAGSVTLDIESRDGGVRVTVADDGPGIEAKDLPAAFEPIQSQKRGHLGMGLSVARRFVEMHGGHITLRPNDPKGAAVEIFLPARQGSE